jgi:hypothetical protein
LRWTAAAGIPYVIDGPDGPLYADFHSLRHTYVALLDRSGASLKQAMQLARHSDPKLTMARYGRAQLHDLEETVRRSTSSGQSRHNSSGDTLWPCARSASHLRRRSLTDVGRTSAAL